MAKRQYRGRTGPAPSADDKEISKGASRAHRPITADPVVEEATSRGRVLPNSAVQRLAHSGSLVRPISVGISRLDDPGVGGLKPAKNEPKPGTMGYAIAVLLREMRLMKRGEMSEQVMLLQFQLNQLGASPELNLDSMFGPKTQRAVKIFQKENGLDPDGIVGIKTRRAIQARMGLKATLAALAKNLAFLAELRKRLGIG